MQIIRSTTLQFHGFSEISRTPLLSRVLSFPVISCRGSSFNSQQANVSNNQDYNINSQDTKSTTYNSITRSHRHLSRSLKYVYIYSHAIRAQSMVHCVEITLLPKKKKRNHFYRIEYAQRREMSSDKKNMLRYLSTSFYTI